jgi:hypothetical protein
VGRHWAKEIMRGLNCILAATLMGSLFGAVLAADPSSKPSTTATPPAGAVKASPATPATAPGQMTEPSAAPPRLPPGYGPDGKKLPPAPVKMVDLNNASKADLMTLPSVGDAEADKIIANRPYISKVDLVTKAGLPQGVYSAVRRRVVVNDMKKPPAKKADYKPSAVKQ